MEGVKMADEDGQYSKRDMQQRLVLLTDVE